MEQDTKNEQVPDQPLVSQKWIKIFLGLNIFALVSFFVWEIGAPAFKSQEELAKMERQDEEAVRAALEKNPPPLDRTGTLSPVIEFTLDATKSDNWAHFSFAKGDVYYKESIDKDSLEWDLAFRRAKVVSNGGATNPNGKVGVAAMGTSDFDSVTAAPASGMIADEPTENIMETKNSILEAWYLYDFWTHQLKPKAEVYTMITAKGSYAKFQFLKYYCLRVAACYNFRYVYQGNGSRHFTE